MAAELKIDKELIAVPPRGVRGGVVSLSQMRGSDIAVMDECSAVNIKTLVDCKVILGPVLGRVVAQDCHGCVFTMVAHELEVRNCTDCIFYTAFCEPSVEESEGIIIGPYNGTLEGDFATLCFEFGMDLKYPGGFVIPCNDGETSRKPNPVKYVFEEDPVMASDGSKLLPKGICILREVFWRFDKDRDGRLSHEEWNAYEKVLKLQPVLQNEDSFQRKFKTELGLTLSADGRLPFASFVKYYEHVGQTVLTEHMAKVNIDINQLPECRVDDMMSRPHDSDLYLETPNDISYHGRGFEPQVEPGRAATSDNRSLSEDSGLGFFAESDEESQVFERAGADHGVKLSQSAARAFMDEFESDDELELPGREKASPLDPFTLNHGSVGTGPAGGRGSGAEEHVGFDYNDDDFEAESDQDTGDGAEVDSGPIISMPKVSTNQWVLECASRLCEGAQHRGVNLQKWFANYDREGRSSLPQKDFETAFSALLLGLCAGSSSAFVQDVERILEPDALNELCRALRDPKDSSRIYYMNMVGDAEKAQQQGRQPARPSGGAYQAPSAPALTTIDSALSDFLKAALQQDRDGLFERLRIAIHEWKHSQAGRTPTQRLGTSDFISILNIRYAIRAALNADASLGQLGDFASMLESRVESIEEQRARTREQTSQSRMGRRNHDGFASLGGSNSNSAAGSQSPPSRKRSTPVREKLSDPCDRHRLVTVAALIRWLGANRVSKNIPREAWLSSKAGRAKRASMLQRSQLKAALNGDREAAIALALPSSRRLLDKALASEEALMSEEALQGEAEGRAHDLLESADGVCMVRKRAVRIANSQEEGEPLPQSKIAELAKTQVLAELVAQEVDALRNTLGPKRELFLEFARGQQLGSIFGSFYDWMEAREGERKKKRAALRSWKRQKASKKRNDRDGDYVYYAAQLFDKLRSLVAQSCSETRDPRSGLLICRSTRYKGLDVESLISAIVKQRLNMLERNGTALSVEESHSRAAKLSAGVFMISQRECCDHFGGLLTTLLADPRTRWQAREMLDPRGTAQHELRALLETKAGQSRLQALGRRQHGLHDEDEQVLDALRAELEEKALGRAGCTHIKSEKEAEELLESAEKARQRKSEQEFRRWAKEKAKRMREQRRTERLQKMEQEKKELERKAKSQKEYQKWKKAARRNEYLSRKASSSEEHSKTKRVLKKRAAVVAEPTEVERVLSRPAWE